MIKSYQPVWGCAGFGVEEGVGIKYDVPRKYRIHDVRPNKVIMLSQSNLAELWSCVWSSESLLGKYICNHLHFN